MKKLSDHGETIAIQTRFHVDAIECDICKRLIIPVEHFRSDETRYFKVTTGHNDWGNDSCESIEHFDICPNCITDFVTKYISEVHGSEYLEIETEHIGPNDYAYR